MDLKPYSYGISFTRVEGVMSFYHKNLSKTTITSLKH